MMAASQLETNVEKILMTQVLTCTDSNALLGIIADWAELLSNEYKCSLYLQVWFPMVIFASSNIQ